MLVLWGLLNFRLIGNLFDDRNYLGKLGIHLIYLSLSVTLAWDKGYHFRVRFKEIKGGVFWPFSAWMSEDRV